LSWSEVLHFTGVLLRREYAGERYDLRVVDTETGEILLTRSFCDSPGLFPDGCNAVQRQVMFGREATDDGTEYIVVTDYDQDPPAELVSFWRQPFRGKRKKEAGSESGEKTEKRGRTGGKSGYVKLYDESFSEAAEKLTDTELGFFLRLFGCVDWDSGRLVDRKKKEPLSIAGVARKTGESERSVRRKISALMESGVLREEEVAGFFVNREYIAKG